MTKSPEKVDRAVLAELVTLGAERDFVRFILAYDGAYLVKSIVPEGDSKAFMKRLKRRVQGLAGASWRGIWAGVKQVRQALRKVRLEETLFTLEPLPPRPPGRPRNLSRWLAFYDLRTYLVTLSGSPQGRLIGRLLFPHLKPSSVEEEWSRRSAWFEGIDAQARLDGLRRFYEAHQRLIRRALVTGRPLRDWLAQGAGAAAQPTPAAPEGLQVSRYVGQCPHCGTEYTFLRFPTIPDPRPYGAGQEIGWRTAVCECGGSFAWTPGPAGIQGGA